MPQTFSHHVAVLDCFSILPLHSKGIGTPALTAIVNQAQALVEHEELGSRAVLCLQDYISNVGGVCEVQDFDHVTESEILTNRSVLELLKDVL